MLQFLKMSSENPLVRFFGLAKKDISERDYESIKNDEKQPFFRFVNDETGNERIEFAVTRVDREGDKPSYGYKAFSAADPRLMDNSTKDALLNVSKQVMGEVHAMYHGADAAKAEMSKANADFYQGIVDETVQSNAGKPVYDAMDAFYKEKTNSYQVRLFKNLLDDMPASVRDDMITSGHLRLANEFLNEHIRLEIGNDTPFGAVQNLTSTDGLSEESVKFIDALYNKISSSDTLYDRLNSADDNYSEKIERLERQAAALQRIKDANAPFDSIAAGFDEDKNSYNVRIYGEFSDKMFASVRDNLIESGHLVLADGDVGEFIRTGAAIDPDSKRILFNADMHVSEDAYNFMDDLHKKTEATTQLASAIKRADESYYHAMTIENTPDDFLHPDRDDNNERDYDNDYDNEEDHTSSVYIANAQDDYDRQRETYEMTVENTPDDFLYPDRDDGYTSESKKSFYHDVNMDDFSVKAEFIDEAGTLVLQAHNDFSHLNQDDRQNLVDTGYLKSDSDGNEYLAYPATVYAGDTDFDLVVDYENSSDRTADLLSTVVGRLHNEDLNTLEVLVEARGDSLSEATRLEQATEVVAETQIEDASYDQGDFKVKQVGDGEMAIKLPKLELLETEYQGTIDHLHESGHLVVSNDGSCTLRVDVDEKGKVLDAEDTAGYDRLPVTAQMLLEAVHGELGHELQTAVDNHYKDEAKDNVVSHHGFLKENKMHQSGYMLLSVEGDDWKDVPEADLREHGLSIADGKWAAKFTLDDSGKPVFESRATSSIGKEFERQHLDTHANVVDWACNERHQKNEVKRLAQAEAYAEKNGFILKNEGDKYALLPKSQIAVREDGLKSVMATVGTTDHFTKLQSLTELKSAMREAKALDKEHHQQFNNREMPFNVITPRAWDYAVRKFEENDKLKTISIKTTGGEKIQLTRPVGRDLDYTQRDLGITSKNVATGQAGQRVVVNGTREHSDAVQNSMVKDGIYISQTKNGYLVGHLQEPKPRYFEKTQGMALRAAVVTKTQIAQEKQVAAQRQAHVTKAKEQESSSAVMSA